MKNIQGVAPTMMPEINVSIGWLLMSSIILDLSFSDVVSLLCRFAT
jgi:hypothetical protein